MAILAGRCAAILPMRMGTASMQLFFNSTRKGAGKASHRTPVLTVVLLAMTALLIIVAVLQYRWTAGLNDAMEVRLGSSLQSSMTAWVLDFYGELSAICVALQVGPDSGARDNWDDYIQRYAEWSRAELEPNPLENIYRNPDLIENIYIWETSRGLKTHLLRLNAHTRTLEPSQESQALQPLLERLQESSSSLLLALRAWKFPAPPPEHHSVSDSRLSPLRLLRSNAITGWQFDATIPAIVHPIVPPSNPQLQQGARVRSIQDPVDWIIVVFNLETIQKRVLPGLAKRYFDKGNGLDYKLAVIATGQTHRLIYSSDSGFGDQTFATYDSIMDIFGPPPESVEGHFWEAVRNSELQGTKWHQFSGPVWFPVIQYRRSADPWRLVLKRRTGSLEATVTGVRRKNFITGGLVLVLLATAMVFLVIASRRAQKLATLQLNFVASVSHELLTPLAALHSTGQNIRDGLVEGKHDLLVHGSIITSQTHQLTNLVTQILQFSSTENQGNRYVLRPLQVPEIIECALKNVTVLIDEMNFAIEQHVPVGLPRVEGDLSAVSVCLQNLIVNAVKYSGKNRWIGIQAEHHKTKHDYDEIRISVHDHGLGIGISELPHVFEPFYRSPSVMAAQIRGTGLGLAVARRIARALGGDLTVSSELGVGSIFTLHLRVAEELIAVDASTAGSLEGRNE